MNLIRQIVGGPKNRYKHDGFNLDLTYITKRIIAMAFPGSGIEKIYRNSIDVVAEFLLKNHQQNYLIMNISGREIDEGKFKNVKSYEWEDHKSPPLALLFEMCWTMAQFLRQNERNITVIHCNHGKGRTGTLICCFLLMVKDFETPADAMGFYSKKRFESEGMGVSQPCQIQYIEYFWKILKGNYFPKPVYLTKIIVKEQQGLNNPYYKIKNIVDQKIILNTREKQLSAIEFQKEKQHTIILKEGIILIGDNTIDAKQQTKIGKNIIGSYTFNTAFWNEKQGVCEVSRGELSPKSIVKGSGITQKFMLSFHYRRVCKCKYPEKLEGCELCEKYLKIEKKAWQTIYHIKQSIHEIKNFELLSGLKFEDDEEEIGPKMKRKTIS